MPRKSFNRERGPPHASKVRWGQGHTSGQQIVLLGEQDELFMEEFIGQNEGTLLEHVGYSLRKPDLRCSWRKGKPNRHGTGAGLCFMGHGMSEGKRRGAGRYTFSSGQRLLTMQ